MEEEASAPTETEERKAQTKIQVIMLNSRSFSIPDSKTRQTP